MQFLDEVFYEETTDQELSAVGLGVSYRKSNPTNIHVPDLMEFQLIHYLEEILGEVKKIGYTGIFLHFDNLELLSREDLGKCQHLFEEIRDIMQIPDIYYIFVAKKGFYSQIIAPLERVASIMAWPIQVPPLTCEEILQAIHTRFKLLSMSPGKEVPPVGESFIKKLYHLHQGKMRFIMDAITQIASRVTSSVRTLSDEEAEEILLEITKIKTHTLSPVEYQILLTALQFEEFTNDKISALLEMDRGNVSRIFKKFLEANLIYLARRHGKRLYYKAVDNLKSIIEFNPDGPALSSFPPQASLSPQKKLSKAKRLEEIQKHLKKHKKISRSEYQEITGVPGPTASRDLALLCKEGILLKEGGGRGTYYIYQGGKKKVF